MERKLTFAATTKCEFGQILLKQNLQYLHEQYQYHMRYALKNLFILLLQSEILKFLKNG